MAGGQNQSIEELPVTEIAGVSPQLASRLEKIGIFQVKDLIFHFPFRYQDRTRVTPLGSLSPGENAVVVGKITSSAISFSGRRSLVVRIADETGRMTMRLFHFTMKQKEHLLPGKWMRCFGEVRYYQRENQMIHPEYSVFSQPPPRIQADNLTPVYRRTEGITHHKMRSIIASALKFCAEHQLPDLVPREILEKYELPDLNDSLQRMHAPPNDALQPMSDSAEVPALRRFVFEELLAFQAARRRQKQLRRSVNAVTMTPQGELSFKLRKSLPFEPTDSQRKVIREVLMDLKKQHPMLRLVQGDVGSGKTLVAAAAAAWAVDSDYQVAVMAPTELLAEQHFQTFSNWFLPLGITVCLLTGRLGAKDRRAAVTDLRRGNAKIVIGTHALFQESVEYKKLGLIIIDEQHRFGVGQRFALREKGIVEKQVPHQLIMTATPIPRTLSMTLFADLDVSSITELPPGRIPIQTAVYSTRSRRRVTQRIREICRSGQQAYWVCPIIDKSEILDVESATEAEAFIKSALPELRVALVHGRLKSQQRDRIMNRFRKGEIDILVATTVIEVGVDVPNASFMVIESAERLGLAQLHQLRGRVGRGAAQAHCVLLYKGALSSFAKERLSVMRKTSDGFEIAETDLKLRGAGELLGTRQTGAQLYRIAELPRDIRILECVNQCVDALLLQHPHLASPLIRRWTVREGHYSAV